jgi:dTDP-4-dehydrorhamnose 3,5-epimerase
MESFNEQRFRAGLRTPGLPVPRPFVQDNHSCSNKGVLRGLHYQLPPHVRGKLVRVVQGSVFDVAVDIRESSPTFGHWVGMVLNSHNKHMLWIPEGFAHGFMALEDDTHFLYKTTDYYTKGSEAATRWHDPELAISWPDVDHVSINPKDASASTLKVAPKYPVVYPS